MSLPSYKDIVALLKAGATIEAQEKIMELREAALELQNENISLKQQVRELREQNSLRERLVYRAPTYAFSDSPTERFCQKCFDVDGKVVRVRELEKGFWRCMNCDNDFTSDEYDPSAGFEPGLGPGDPVVGY